MVSITKTLINLRGKRDSLPPKGLLSLGLICIKEKLHVIRSRKSRVRSMTEVGMQLYVMLEFVCFDSKGQRKRLLSGIGIYEQLH